MNSLIVKESGKMKRVYQIFSGTQKDLFKQVVDHIGYFESLHITDI